MGTQFRSRLTDADRKLILEGIEEALSSVTQLIEAPKPEGERPKRPKTVPSISSLSRSQVRKLGDATVRQVLTVADARGFFPSFAQSTAFEDLLVWLKALHNDAVNNGFQGIIKKYDLYETDNPVRALNSELDKLARKNMLDPYRVEASSAAKTILAAAQVRSVSPRLGESRAQEYGRKLATFELQDVVNRYIYNFVNVFVSKVVSMANPSGAALIQDAVAEYVKGIAKRAVTRIGEENNLCNSARTHEIVREELAQFVAKV